MLSHCDNNNWGQLSRKDDVCLREYPTFLSLETNLTRKFHELENQVEKVGILTEMFFVTSNFSSDSYQNGYVTQ